MRVAIVGAGIAGLATALRLGRGDDEVVVLERSAQPRGEGYMLDFFGPGLDAAERLGLWPGLESIHSPIRSLIFGDARGRRHVSLPYRRLRHRVFDDRHFNFLRGDLERVLREALPPRVELRYGAEVAGVRQDGAIVAARLSGGDEVEADLLVGADGVHSTVRRAEFGPDERHVVDLGHVTAASLHQRLPGGAPRRAFTTLSAPSRMVAVYPIRGDRAASFFAHRREIEPTTLAAPVERLRVVYGEMGAFVPELLEDMTDADLYLDDVIQVRMDRWSRGRVVLVGDAAWCVSLLAGQGASLGVAGGSRLADAIATSDEADPAAALRRWEAELRPTVEARAEGGRTTADWFVPPSTWRIWVRDLLMGAATLPVVSRVIRDQLGIGVG